MDIMGAPQKGLLRYGLGTTVDRLSVDVYREGVELVGVDTYGLSEDQIKNMPDIQ